MQYASAVVVALLALWNQGPNAMVGVPTGYPKPHGRTAVIGTAAAMLALMQEGVPHTSRPLSEMKLYLLTTQHDDGGYGSPVQTALVIKALREAEVSGTPVQRAFDYMARTQSPTGGWPTLPDDGAGASLMSTGYIVAVVGDVPAFRKSVNWGAALRQTKDSPKQSADGRLVDLPTTQVWLEAATKGSVRGGPFDLRAAKRWYDAQPNTPAAVRNLVATGNAEAFASLIADETVCKAEGQDALRGIAAARAILENLGGPADLPTIRKLKQMQDAAAG